MSKDTNAGDRVLERDPPPPEPRPSQGRSVGATRATRGRRVKTFFVRTVEVLAIIGGLTATAVIAAAITYTMAVRSNEVIVPDLGGASIDAAREQLQRNELQLVLQGNRFSATIPPDFIALQTPTPGTTLKKGRSIRVWVSLGPEKRTVPRIEGESLQSAQLILEQSGFSLGRVVEVHSDYSAPDTVVAQSPQPYEDVGDVTEVAVLLSRGYVDEMFVMPDFIGHDYAELLDRVSRGAVKVSRVQLVDYPGVDKNIVVGQRPEPGTKVSKRDRIVLYLSRGPRP